MRYNCWVNVSAEDSELVELLTQLLRVVSPEGTGPGSPAGGYGHLAAGGQDTGAGQPAAEQSAARPPLPVLSTSEARALIELVAARGISQGQLGTLLGLEKSTVSRLAAGLERKGWVRRGRDEGNQRYVRLYLTPEGGVIAARVWQAWHSRQERIVASLSPEERTGLSAGLRGLVRGLAAEGILGEARPASAGENGS